MSLFPRSLMLNSLCRPLIFQVYNLSWIERQIAMRLFATPPSATLQDAKSEFLEVLNFLLVYK